MSIYLEAWQVCVHYAVLFFSFGFNALLLVRRCSNWDGVLADEERNEPRRGVGLDGDEALPLDDVQEPGGHVL